MTFLVLEERHSLRSKKDIPCFRRMTFLSFEDNIPCVRRKTFLVFEEGHSLCSKKNIPCVRRRTFLVFEDDETPIFGRTDLRKGVSEAKFDAEADFEVKKSLASPKSAENHEKPKKQSRKQIENIFFVSSICFSIRNRLKRVLAKFRRSKTAKNWLQIKLPPHPRPRRDATRRVANERTKKQPKISNGDGPFVFYF